MMITVGTITDVMIIPEAIAMYVVQGVLVLSRVSFVPLWPFCFCVLGSVNLTILSSSGKGTSISFVISVEFWVGFATLVPQLTSSMSVVLIIVDIL